MLENNINAPQLAERMGIEKQSVYFQLKKKVISDSFKHKLFEIGVNIFHLSTSDSTQSTVSEDNPPYEKLKKGEPIMMENNYLRQRVKDLEKQLSLQDELLNVYRTKTPKQRDTAQGSKKVAV